MPEIDTKLKELDIFHGFIRRHIGPADEDVADMLRALDMGSVDELLDRVVPESIRRRKPLEIKASISERQVLNRLYQVSIRNQLHKSWNTKFLQHVKYNWAKRNALETHGGQQGTRATGRTRDRSLSDDLNDRSWAH